MKGFLTRHKEAIILILLIAAVFGVQHLQIQRKEAQMRADVKAELTGFLESYHQVQTAATQETVEGLYDDFIRYYQKVYTWYAYCEEHDLLGAKEIVQSWMCFGQVAEEMKSVFAELFPSEYGERMDFEKKVDEAHIKTIQRGLDYLNEGRFDYITFDSYNRKTAARESAVE